MVRRPVCGMGCGGGGTREPLDATKAYHASRLLLRTRVGLNVARSVVRALPPRLSRRSIVSTDDRYGMCAAAALAAPVVPTLEYVLASLGSGDDACRGAGGPRNSTCDPAPAAAPAPALAACAASDLAASSAMQWPSMNRDLLMCDASLSLLCGGTASAPAW